MAYTVEISVGAGRQLPKLPRDTRRQVGAAIDGLAEDPRPHGYLKLAGRREQHRIRVGDYRVVYEINGHLHERDYSDGRSPATRPKRRSPS